MIVLLIFDCHKKYICHLYVAQTDRTFCKNKNRSYLTPLLCFLRPDHQDNNLIDIFALNFNLIFFIL